MSEKSIDNWLTLNVVNWRFIMKMKSLCSKLFLMVVMVVTIMLPCRATHLVGGELIYTYLGNNNYQLKLKVWRDCNSSTGFDDPAIVSAYDNTSLLRYTFSMSNPVTSFVVPVVTNPCLVWPPGVCVEQAIYTMTVNLPPIPGGYVLAYQRCCRNNSIVNLVNPGNTGVTYMATIPDFATNGFNSSPEFTNYPPIVICADEPIVFDHSAIDPDGDSLVYSMCTPYQGGDASNPNPAFPPPYQLVNWLSPFSQANQIGGMPGMNINPVTGLLTGYPNSVGNFVVGVCVSEYRNGVLLDVHLRDFQFYITSCNPSVVADFTTAFGSDSILVCGNQTVNFTNTSTGATTYQWNFGDPTTTNDVSTLENPSYTYPDTGFYHVVLIANPGLPCDSTTTQVIEIRDGAVADFNFTSECALVPLPFFDLSQSLDGTLSNWSWSFGDGTNDTLQNPVHPYTTGGTFNATLTVTDSHGCTDSETKPVLVFPLPNPMAAPDTMICNIDSVMLHAFNGVSYQWNPSVTLNASNIANPMASPDFNTTYTVTVTDANGCVNTDSVTVLVVDTVVASTSNDTTICEGQTVQLWAQGAVYYQWNFDPSLSNINISNPDATPITTTTYFVTSFIGSCFDEDTIHVQVLPAPVPDAGEAVTINQGESTQLQGSGGASYFWFPGLTLNDFLLQNPTATPINTTTYYLNVTGDNGCQALDSVIVYVTHNHLILAPTAFTPNGDGLNDYFSFYTKGVVDVLSFQIYNRWGQLIFNDNTNIPGWDGTYKGKDQEIGTYVFLATAKTFDGDVISFKGDLTLLR